MRPPTFDTLVSRSIDRHRLFRADYYVQSEFLEGDLYRSQFINASSAFLESLLSIWWILGNAPEAAGIVVQDARAKRTQSFAAPELPVASAVPIRRDDPMAGSVRRCDWDLRSFVPQSRWPHGGPSHQRLSTEPGA